MDEITQTVDVSPVQTEKRINPAAQKIWAGTCYVARVLYLLRKVFLAIPVLYLTVKLALYNQANLPDTVGLLLQADGSFMMEFSRTAAVLGSAGITVFCLVMMLLSRKALYSWAISIFTLALPVLLLVSNIYPS